MDWIAQSWHVVWGLICLAAMIAALVHFRRNPQAPGARLFFRMVPFSDPTGTTQTGLTPRAVVLWLFGVLIVLLAFLFVPGFA